MDGASMIMVLFLGYDFTNSWTVMLDRTLVKELALMFFIYVSRRLPPTYLL